MSPRKPNRSGFSNPTRPIDDVRNRRSVDEIPLGDTLEWRGGKLEVKSTGALVGTRDGLLLELSEPLSQASPVRLNVDSETLEVQRGTLKAKRLRAGDGIRLDGDRIVSDVDIVVGTGAPDLRVSTAVVGTKRTITIDRDPSSAISDLDGSAALSEAVTAINSILAALRAQGVIADA